MKNIDIIRVTHFEQKLLEGINQLLPQLTQCKIRFSEKEMQEIIQSPHTYLYLARDVDIPQKILGCLTLIVLRIPSAKTAYIEDVVVDSAARKEGIGELLMRKAVSEAKSLGASKISLTSHPRRKAANRLYQRLHFELRDTNFYCLNLEC